MSDRIVPIIIFGAAHSGTTILHKMLAFHPEVTWFSQFTQRDGSIPGRFSLPLHHQLDRVLRRAKPHDWRKGGGGILWVFTPEPTEATRTWDYMLPEGTTVAREECLRRMRRVIQRECELWQKEFLIAKQPRLYKNIDLLKEAFASAKLVHIVRDGRAVAFSTRHKYMRNGESPAEALAASTRVWVDVVARVNQKKKPAGILEFRYEDFCEDTHQFISRVLDASGLKTGSFPFHKVPRRLSATNVNWLGRADPTEVRAIESIGEEYLRYHGYLEA